MQYKECEPLEFALFVSLVFGCMVVKFAMWTNLLVLLWFLDLCVSLLIASPCQLTLTFFSLPNFRSLRLNVFLHVSTTLYI